MARHLRRRESCRIRYLLGVTSCIRDVLIAPAELNPGFVQPAAQIAVTLPLGAFGRARCFRA